MQWYIHTHVIGLSLRQSRRMTLNRVVQLSQTTSRSDQYQRMSMVTNASHILSKTVASEREGRNDWLISLIVIWVRPPAGGRKGWREGKCARWGKKGDMKRVRRKSGRAKGREGCRREWIREGDYDGSAAFLTLKLSSERWCWMHTLFNFMIDCYPQETVLQI